MFYERQRYASRFAPYVPVAQRRASAAAKMAKRSKTGAPVAPVVVKGRAIASTFWGRAWCDNLEQYSDYANRLPRGRTYVRNGSVVHLEVAPGVVSAYVAGTRLYKIEVKVTRLAPARWTAICQDCVGGIDSLVELLRGEMDDGVMTRVCRPGEGLFPQPKEIQFTCSCPDYASMCKHVAATLYGVGARLDADPSMIFSLRGVSAEELASNATAAMTTRPKKAGGGARRLADADVATVFGVDLEGGAIDSPAPQPGSEHARPKRTAKGKGKGKPKAKAKPPAKKARRPKTARKGPARA